jgi:hypothetical protein
MKRNSTLCFVLMLATALLPGRAKADDAYSAIDRHALAAPADVEQSVSQLASYLARPCKTDLEKVRAVYRWMTDRVAYDVESFRRGKGGDDQPEGVLTARKAVCEGYASLFADLCSRMGLTAAKVSGFGKGLGYRSRVSFQRTNHAWNAVQLDGKWRLLDATWGAGVVDQNRYIKRFSEFYFLVPPEKLIFTHFPEEARWQLLDAPITQKQFEQRPKISQELFELGASVKAIHDAMNEEGFRDFVKTYSHPGRNTAIICAPVALYLPSAEQHSFELTSGDYGAIILINGGKSQPFQQDGNVFRHTGTLRRGPAKIAGTLKGEQTRYHTFLEYSVK